MKHAAHFILIAPDIRSAHNVGALFRTADGCGVDYIYLVGYTPQPPRPDIAKVALGADTWVPWEHKKSLIRLVKSLQKSGVYVVALEKTADSVEIDKSEFTGPLALIVGNEVDGVPASVLRLVDKVVHIPMHGQKESLNVSVAAGIAMYVIGSSIAK
jgi:tRNA G18 (ribose-2'-O)-methylase SpoU